MGDAAIATMVVETKGTFMGNPVPPSSRSTDFFVRRDGRWQAVSTQNMAVKPPGRVSPPGPGRRGQIRL